MSKEIVRAVSRQLDHYLRVQRLEDGFDHSGTLNPAPLHPPLWDASGSLISARRLHDKPLKHQFSDRQLRSRLRRMHPSEGSRNSHSKTADEVEEEGESQADSHRGSERTATSSVNFAKRIEARLDRQRPLVLPQPRPKHSLRGAGSNGFLRSAPPMPCSRRERDFLVRSSGEILTYLAADGDSEDVDGKSGGNDGCDRQSRGRAGLAKKKTVKVAATGRKRSGGGKTAEEGDGDEEGCRRGESSEASVYADEEPQVVHIVAPPEDAASSLNGGSDDFENYYNDPPATAPGPHCYDYTVTVVTGDRVGAGTRHPVRLTLCGDRGASQPVLLSNSRTHRRQFARGRTDKFFLTGLPNVGQLRRIKVEHLANGPGDSAYAHWFLQSVDIVEPSGERRRFPCQAWLSAKSVDRRTVRWLNVEASSGEAIDVATEDEEDKRRLTKNNEP
uniref:PLAT domain-containing protein n=1 Tax=Macrostomum lignano TaxID=282301 RepID=A0A1I8HVR1_9PLAT